MSFVLRKYRQEVLAVLITHENIFKVAEWCYGRIRQPGNKGVSRGVIEYTTNQTVSTGEWLVRLPTGEHIGMSDWQFKRMYEEA